MSRATDRAAAVPREARAEQNVLGCCLAYGRAAADALAELNAALFFEPLHAEVFTAWADLLTAGQPCQAGDVAEALTRAGNQPAASAALELMHDPGAVAPSVARVELDKLVDATQRRQRLSALDRERADLLNMAMSVADTFAAARESLERIEASGREAAGSSCSNLGDLRRPADGDGAELLRHRYLCCGGGLLLVGPTGIGKSSFTLQCLLLWALGREAFGIVPARPLRALLIQAENDDGDLAEMRDGVLRGLELSLADRERAAAAILVRQEDGRTRAEFFARTVEPLLREHGPDLLVIDPALAYLGGESNSQADVGGFLRNGLNPLLHRYHCGGIVVHHTNKPPTGQEKNDWAGGDFAYLGGGSAEWANWPRAVVAIRSVGSHEVFELRLGKRGGRAGWKNADTGEKLFHRHIAHATEPGAICWREVDPSEVESASRGGKRNPQPEDLLAYIPELDPVEIDSLLGQVQAAGTMGVNKARDFLAVLKGNRKVFEWHLPRLGKRPMVAFARRSQPASEQSSRPGTSPVNIMNKAAKSDVHGTPIPPEGGVCVNMTTPGEDNHGREHCSPGSNGIAPSGKNASRKYVLNADPKP